MASSWQRNFANRRAIFFQNFNPLHNSIANIGLQALTEKLCRQANGETINASLTGQKIIGHRYMGRGRIAGIVPSNNAEQGGRIFDSTRKWANLIERRGISDQAITRNATISGFETHHIAKRCGQTNRPPRVRPQSHKSLTGSNGRSRATAGSACYAGLIAWIFDRTKMGIFAGRAHGKLIHIEFAQDDCIGLTQTGNNGCVIRGDKIVEDF